MGSTLGKVGEVGGQAQGQEYELRKGMGGQVGVAFSKTFERPLPKGRPARTTLYLQPHEPAYLIGLVLLHHAVRDEGCKVRLTAEEGGDMRLLYRERGDDVTFTASTGVELLVCSIRPPSSS